jgi:hypothetical protein
MKTTHPTGSPYLALLRNELGIDQWSTAGIIQYLFVQAVLLTVVIVPTALLLDREPMPTGNFPMFTAPAFLWLLMLSMYLSHASIPATWSAVPHFKAFEFMFTRAVDRRINYRAKATAIAVVTLVPLLINLVASFFHPDVKLALYSRFSEHGAVDYARIATSFPAAQILHGTITAPEVIRLPTGYTAVAVFELSMAVFCIACIQGFFATIGRLFEKKNLVVSLAVMTPALLLVGTVLVATLLGVNILEEAFLTFHQHAMAAVIAIALFAVANQLYGERKFSRLEIH